MKKLLVFSIVLLLVAGAFGCKTMTGGSQATTLVPGGLMEAEVVEIDGDDVAINLSLLKNIPAFDVDKAVYAACLENGWGVGSEGKTSPESLEKSEGYFDGSGYIFDGMRGKRFTPFQYKDENGGYVDSNINWLPLHKFKGASWLQYEQDAKGKMTKPVIYVTQ